MAGLLVERMVTAEVTVPAGGGPVSVSEPKGFERRVDPSGRTLSEGSFPLALNPNREVIGKFGCSGRGSSPGLRDHSETGPVRLDVNVGGGSARSVFHISSLVGGRQADGHPTVQVLICSAGGARFGSHGSQRVLQAGIGAAYDDTEHSYILGKQWPVGDTPDRAQDSYSFAGGDAGADGTIEQDPSGELEGSFLGPFPTDFDNYFRNGMAGWWEHPCLDGDACGPTDGSAVFQGSLAGGLWEFYDDTPRDYRFRVALFFAVACAEPLDCLS